MACLGRSSFAALTKVHLVSPLATSCSHLYLGAVAVIITCLLLLASGTAQANDEAKAAISVHCVIYRTEAGHDACLPPQEPDQPAGQPPLPAEPAKTSSDQACPAIDPLTDQDKQEMEAQGAPCLHNNGDAAKNKCLEHGLGGGLRLQVTGDFQKWAKQNNPWDLILFLNERPLKGLHPISVNTCTNEIHFRLTRNSAVPEQKAAWDDLLQRVTSLREQRVGAWQSQGLERTVRASVGMEGGVALPTTAKFNLVVLECKWLIFFVIFSGALLVCLLWMATSTSLLRDSRDQSGLSANLKPTFSLARFQMAVWTLLIVVAYVFVWIITKDGNIDIPAALLALMGISSTTFVAAAAVDSSKRGDALTQLPAALAQESTLQAELQAAQTANDQTVVVLKQTQLTAASSAVTRLQATAKPASSRGFIKDIFYDSGEPSLHRVQIVVWTLVVIAIFIDSVWHTLAMPALNLTLLGLLGISAGAYIGFKFPEQK